MQDQNFHRFLREQTGIFLILFLICSTPLYAARYALVIGNSDYGELGYLENPIHDARDMAKLLQAKNFEVSLLTNADLREMKTAIRHFIGLLHQEDAVGLFYYAGHGIEVDKRNFLIPIHSDIKTEDDVEFESVSVDRVIGGMQRAGNRLNMVILDACRNNPFARSFRSASRGLAPIMDVAKGTLLLYAASPGEVASDGTERNGLFTYHLMRSIDTPGLPVEMAFKKAAKKVHEESQGEQTPWMAGIIMDDFYFTPRSSEVALLQSNTGSSPPISSPSSRSTMDQKPVVSQTSPTPNRHQNEVLYWESIKNEKDPSFFLAYLKQYPNGLYADIARLKSKPQEAEKHDSEPRDDGASPPRHRLTIYTNPSQATIKFVNQDLAYQQGVLLPEGQYQIEISAKGYLKDRRWIYVGKEDLEIQVTLIPID